MIRAGTDVLVSRLPEKVKSNLESFINDTTIKSYLKEIQKEFPNFDKYKIEIAKG